MEEYEMEEEEMEEEDAKNGKDKKGEQGIRRFFQQQLPPLSGMAPMTKIATIIMNFFQSFMYMYFQVYPTPGT